MAKLVRYNGKTDSKFFYSGNAGDLVCGKVYEVIAEHNCDLTSNYTLRGIKGTFNSSWFEELLSGPIHLAVSLEMPVIGQSLCCKRISNCKLVDCYTSPVEKIKSISEDVFFVETRNNMYIVQVC